MTRTFCVWIGLPQVVGQHQLDRLHLLLVTRVRGDLLETLEVLGRLLPRVGRSNAVSPLRSVSA